MNVLIWRSYGNTTVYGMSLPADFAALFLRLEKELEHWDLADELKALEHAMQRCKDLAQAQRVFRGFADKFLIGACESTEAFEVFEFDFVRKM